MYHACAIFTCFSHVRSLLVIVKKVAGKVLQVSGTINFIIRFFIKACVVCNALLVRQLHKPC